MLTATVVLCASCGSAPPAAPRPPAPRPVLSRYENLTGRDIARDCGFSAPLPSAPGRSLWLFCDTEITSRQGDEIGLPILGTGTAAEGSYRAGSAPGVLTEVPTPSSPASPDPGTAGLAPQPFLPAPADLTRPATDLPCAGSGVYQARWFTGVAREPGASGHLLISYVDSCVSGSDVFTAEAFGLVDYDPVANVLSSPAQVFSTTPGEQLPPAWILGSPVFSGGYLYLFSSCAPDGGCGTPGVFLTRTLATAANWQNGFSYQYWTGRGWSLSPYSAVPLRAGTPLLVWAGDFSATGHGLVLIEQTSVGGNFTIWQAAAPTGPWRQITAGRVPCGAGKHGRPNGFCRALIGHPELSTRSELLMSFFNPGANHVEVSAFRW